MKSTPATDFLLAAILTLPADEQDEVVLRLTEARELREAGTESETATMIRALCRDHIGEPPSPDAYRTARKQLALAGEDLPEYNRIARHFGGSWRRAKEALELSEVTSVRRIDARFRFRRVGKVWRYNDETLRETFLACADFYGGRAPPVAEFEHWRERELQLTAAQGNDALHLPSPTPYRKRWGTWGALVHHGFTAEQVAGRLEQP